MRLLLLVFLKGHPNNCIAFCACNNIYRLCSEEVFTIPKKPDHLLLYCVSVCTWYSVTLRSSIAYWVRFQTENYSRRTIRPLQIQTSDKLTTSCFLVISIHWELPLTQFLESFKTARLILYTRSSVFFPIKEQLSLILWFYYL